MTLEEKREFISQLIDTVEQKIMDKTGKMPEHWDGGHSRHYIKDSFAEVVWASFKKKPRGYTNECLVNNL